MIRDDKNDFYIPLVPYMPENPRTGYGYIPYQVNPRYYDDLAEAYYYGTVFPELVTPYLEYINREV